MENLRQSLTLYAYNILGSYEDAKDIVQDVFLKFTQVNEDKIADKKSYLIRMVVNLAIDHKRRLKKQVEQYPGPWLPEPLATDDPYFAIHRKEILSYSLLVLLEKLDSKQRAVFILKEAFDYDHDEVAAALGITAENSRKILSRARAELRDDLKITPDEKQIETVSRYLEVLDTGDIKKLEQMLHEDITVTSDGGGKVAALRNVIRGIAPAVALVSGLHRKRYSTVRSEIRSINHQPAIFFFDGSKVITCQIFDIEDRRVRNIFFVRNPDKLEILQKDFQKGVTKSAGLSS